MLKIFQATDLNQLSEQFLKDLKSSQEKNSIFEESLVIIPNLSIQDWLDQKITKEFKISSRIAYQIWLELERYWIENYFKEKYKEQEKDEKNELNPLSKSAMLWDLFSFLLHKSKDIIKDEKDILNAELRKILNKDDYSASQEEIQRLWNYANQMAELLHSYMELRVDWINEYFNKNSAIKIKTLIPNIDDNLMLEHYQQVLNVQHYLWKELFRDNYQKFAETKAEFLIKLKNNPKYKEFFIFSFKNLTEERVKYLLDLAQTTDIYLYLYNISVNSFKDIKDIKWLRKIPAKTRELKHLNFGNELVSRFGKLYREREKLLIKFGLLENVNNLEPKTLKKRTLLQRLQDDIHRLDEENSLNLGDFSKDDSLKIFACHGFNRQLEVLRSEITKWLLADSSRKLEDILILTPSLVAGREGLFAILPPEGGSDGRKLPTKLSGISNKETENLWFSLSGLYQFLLGDFEFLSLKSWFLLSHNCTAYGCSYEDLADAFKALYEAGFRRGFDELHLQNLGIKDADYRFSFSYALDRLILAYTVPNAENYAQRSTAFDRAIKYEALQALCQFHKEISELRKINQEKIKLREIIELMRTRLHNFYEHTASSSAITAIDLSLEEFGRRLGANRYYQKERDRLNLPWKFVLNTLENILHSRRNSAEPSGVITIGQLSDMQNLPYKLIAFVGAENSQFPNQSSDPRYNLIELDRRRAGDVDTESTDLAAFLDVLNVASENCWIFYSSHDKENGEKTSPPAPIAELLQYLENNLEEKNFQKIHIQKAAMPFEDLSDGAKLWAEVRENLKFNQELKPRFVYQKRLSFKEYMHNFAVEKMPLNMNLEELSKILKEPLEHYLKAQKIHLFSNYDELENVEPLEVGGLGEWKIDEYLYKNNFPLHKTQLPLLPAGVLGQKYAELRAAELKQRLSNFAPTPTKFLTRKLKNNYEFSAFLPINEKEELLKNQDWYYFHISKKKVKHQISLYISFLLWIIEGGNGNLIVNFKGEEDPWILVPSSVSEAKQKLFALIILANYIKEYPFLITSDIYDELSKIKANKFNASEILRKYISYVKVHYNKPEQNLAIWNFFANNNFEDENFIQSLTEDFIIVRELFPWYKKYE